jgi:ribosomal subunit interface protein
MEGKAIRIPLQVTFRSMPPSEAIESDIREKAERLEQFYDNITSCRVVVEAPHRRRQKGKLYHVRVGMTVPGSELVVKREPAQHAAHEDIYVAIRDAFDAAKRELQDYARRRRSQVKLHEGSAAARVAKLFPERGYGFLETPDGREIYFHKNSVLEPGFETIAVGAEVSFTEEQGKEGPQASTVRVAGQ